MPTSTPIPAVEIIADVERALILLKEPRPRILDMARVPVSAVDVADHLGESRQRLGYHVRQLVDAGLLREEGRAQRGAMIEKRYVASAEAYALSPDLLGPLAARLHSPGDRESVTHLLGAVHQVQVDLAGVLQAAAPRERLPTLTLSTQVRFLDAAQRGAFADALVRALAEAVGTRSSPARTADGGPGSGDPFRLTLTLNPTPP